MHILIATLFVALFASSALAAESWKPDSNEPYSIDDPRFKALAAYRQAMSAVQVQTFLKKQLRTPGDEVDLLITEFQESLSGSLVSKATEFLKDYPDEEVATTLLLFQIQSTAGIWPPWKRLALALIDRCPNAVTKTFSSLSTNERAKFLADSRSAIAQANSWPEGFPYPLSEDRKQTLLLFIQKLQENNKSKPKEN